MSGFSIDSDDGALNVRATTNCHPSEGEVEPGGVRLYCDRNYMFEPGPVILSADQTRALFRYLAGIVLPTVERIDEVCCYVPKDATMFRNTVSGGGHACVLKGSGDVLYQGNLFAPEWIRGYASMLLAAADEAEGGRQ